MFSNNYLYQYQHQLRHTHWQFNLVMILIPTTILVFKYPYCAKVAPLQPPQLSQSTPDYITQIKQIINDII